MDSKFQNDRHFEECIVQSLIVDHSYAEQLMEVLDLDYFNLEHLKETARLIFDYYKKFNTFPSFKLLVSIVKDLKEEVMKEKIIAYLAKIAKEQNVTDLEYVKEEVLDFCKRRALAISLENSLDLIESKKYEQIVPEVQKALLAGSSKDVGHVYLDSLDKRMETANRKVIPTPYKEINDLIGGGLGNGELGLLMANTGIGKSHWLVDVGFNAALIGYNVDHITLELGDSYLGRRYDSRASEIPFDELPNHKEEVRESLKKIKGNIIIKSFPCKSITSLAIKNHYNQLVLRGKKPDIILVDYVDLLRSSRHYEQKRLEEEGATEELRALAQELDIPIWSLVQSNRSGLSVEVLTLQHVAECYGKAMVADFFMTMNRQKENANNTVGNFFIAKSRLGADGKKFNVLFDTSRSKFEILTADELSANVDNREVKELDAYDLLKQRFRDMQREGKLS